MTNNSKYENPKKTQSWEYALSRPPPKNKDTMLKFIIIVLFTAAIVLASIAIVKMNKGCDSCYMRFNQTKLDGLHGIWSVSDNEEYMCINLWGRTEKQIQDTICHECDHHNIYEDYEHFCGNGSELSIMGGTMD